MTLYFIILNNNINVYDKIQFKSIGFVLYFRYLNLTIEF